MSRVHERLFVRCPFGKAPSFLNYYLDELSRSSGTDGAVLRLEVPLSEIMGIPGGVTVSRDVVAHFAPVTDNKFGVQQTAIDWAPVDGGPFPKFVGSLTVEADENYGSCSLVLEGAYDPPLGAVGVAFDAALGQRIANATARELLRALRDKLELDFKHATKQTVR